MRTWDCYYWPQRDITGIRFAQVKAETKPEAMRAAMKKAPPSFSQTYNDYFVLCTEGLKITLK